MMSPYTSMSMSQLLDQKYHLLLEQLILLIGSSVMKKDFGLYIVDIFKHFLKLAIYSSLSWLLESALYKKPAP